METHRSGPLKQKNKPHKGPKKKTRKDSITSARSFRSISTLGSKKGSSVARIVRKNQLAQIRKCKREELINARRGIALAPTLISVLNLDSSHDSFVKLLQNFDPSATVLFSKRGGYFNVFLPRFRSKYQIVFLNKQDLFGCLDLVKISDLLLILHSTNLNTIELFEENTDLRLFDAIYNHCLPQTVHGIVGLNKINNIKQRDKIRKTILEFLEKNYKGTLDGNNKLRTIESSQDFFQFFHYCSNIKRKINSYCSRRSQLLAEDVNFVPKNDDPNFGTLLVDGYVRNNPLNVNSLVYVPEFGEFQMDLIECVENTNFPQKYQENINYREQADPDVRPSLVKENEVETIFEEEMRAMEQDMNQSNPLEKKKVPKGTSDYQAAWIVDSDNEEGTTELDEESDLEDNEMAMDDDTENVPNGKKVHFAPVEASDEFDCEKLMNDEVIEQDDAEEKDELGQESDVNYDADINMDEDAQTLQQFKEQRMYELFPDEIDTPMDRPARERFTKYRGLKSFRTSTWDSKENLPPDYSRIFQFENFNRTRRRLFKTEPIGADPGYFVRVHLANVPRALFDYYNSTKQAKPLVLYELLAHEHKMSVQNLVLKKLSTFTEPIRSKERLVFHLGCRRFAARPIFSAHTIGDKHKYEKYLRADVACVATIYAPITFPPAPVLVYKEYPDGSHHLVATGSLLDCSPDRMVIKRLILSGHPFKINRKHAVVRYMFFNRDDILWFRPVELRTKYGRRGHILEPLGTHGHMKCVFDHQLNSQDTVLMCLYKRVFPKWDYQSVGWCEPVISSSNEANQDNQQSTMVIDSMC